MSAATGVARIDGVADTGTAAAKQVVPVLLYHDISDGSAGSGFRRFVVPPGLLDEHLSALQSAGYRTANANLVPADSGHTAHDPQTVFLTFDDGLSSFARSAVPAMLRYGMTGTVFVPTAYVGGRAAWLAPMGEDHRTLMTWSELSEVIASGMEVGAHGHRHLHCDLVAQGRMRSELNSGRAILEEQLGVQITSLAYPFGWHSRSVRAEARASGYQVAFEVGDNVQRGVAPSPASDGVLRVRRLVVDTDVTGDDLLHLVKHGRRGPAIQRVRCMARPAWRVARRFSASGRQSLDA